MLVCSCNIISDREIRQAITVLLREDPWRLIVPLQVYHAMKKRGKCCGCFPQLVDLIIETTQAFHRELDTPDCEIVSFLDRLRDRHRECETARLIARKRMEKIRAA
ncbi:MAG: (2Fe-2S)-binding protein [Salaquimonas sp.]|jgi:bacterioferritin-associated ferredoxin|nr:(2Fe-2S)-binding protein [Salaquimonas sp.]